MIQINTTNGVGKSPDKQLSYLNKYSHSIWKLTRTSKVQPRWRAVPFAAVCADPSVWRRPCGQSYDPPPCIQYQSTLRRSSGNCPEHAADLQDLPQTRSLYETVTHIQHLAFNDPASSQWGLVHAALWLDCSVIAAGGQRSSSVTPAPSTDICPEQFRQTQLFIYLL